MFLAIGSLIFAIHLYPIACITTSGAVAEGTVTKLLPNDHQNVLAEYEVGSRMYISKSGLQPPNPDFSHIRSGDRIMIYYNTEEPGSVVFGDPASLLLEESLGVVFGSAFLAFIAAYKIREYVSDKKGNGA